MSRRSRIGLVIAAVLLGLPVLLASTVLLIGNTDAGRRLIERATLDLSHGKVTLQGLSGRFPDRLHLSDLRLSDANGVWLEAEDTELDTSPLALLSRRAQVHLLHIARLAISRRPDYPPTQPQHASEGSWIHETQLDELDLQRVELGAPLTGEASAFRVRGSAQLQSAHSARLQLMAQRLDAAAGIYEAHAQIDGKQVDATVDLQEAAGGPLTQLAHVQQLGALDLHIRLQGPSEAVQTLIHVGAGPLIADVTGSVNLDHPAADLRIDGESAAITPILGVSWRQLSLHGAFRGTPSAPTADLNLKVDGLIAPGVASSRIDASLRGQSEKLLLDANIIGLTLQSPQLAVPPNKPILVHAESSLADKDQPVDFTLTSSLLNLRGHWNIATSNGSASADLPDIRPVMALGGLDLKGRGTLEANFSVSGNTGRLQTHMALDVSGGATPMASLLRPRTTATATVLFRPDGLELQDTHLSSDHAQIALDGTVLDDRMKVSYKASLPDLAALSPQLRGKMNLTGTVRGKSPSLDLDADATGELAAHGAPSGPLHLIVHAHDLPRRVNGSLELNGRLDGAAINVLASAAATSNGAVVARIERGDWKSAHVEGTLQSDPSGQHANGRIELRMLRLADLDRLLAQPLEGSVQASIALDDRNGADRAQISVVASDVGLSSQLLYELRLRGQIDRPLTKPSLALELQADAKLDDRLAHLTAQARGPLDKLQLTSRINLDAIGEGEGAADAAAQFDAAAILDVGQSKLTLTALNADYRKSNLRLVAPALIDYGTEFKVDQLRLKSADADLQIAGRVSPTLALHVRASNLTSAQLQALSPSLAIEGQLNAKADLGGEPAHPTGHIEIHGAGLRAGGGAARSLPASNLDLKIELAATSAQLDLQMHAGQGLDLALSGQIPLDPQAAMELKANGAFDLNILNPILEAQGQQAQGTVRIDAHIAGTSKSPQAHGTLVLAGVNMQDYAHGARLRDIQATINAEGQTLTLQQFNARAGSGNVTATGTVKLDQSDWPVNIRLSGRDAQLLASDLLTANIDFDASLSGALRTRLTTSGTVHINRAVINIPSALPPSIQTLHMIRPGQGASPPPAAGGPVVALDYRVSALHAVFVRGRGIDSEFGGEIHVQGTSDQIAISGGFEMRQGSIALGGTTLQFDHDSRMAFNGTGVENKITPTLDFSATNSTGTATSATLKVTGYADAPVITLSSVPEMPQDQILSQLLFGTSNVSTLSALQLASIGSALVTLGGVGGGGGGGFNPINTVQKKLGLDRLSIGGGGSSSGAQQASASSGDSTAATVEAGRYVSSRVYVGAKQSTAGATQVEVQVDLTQRLKLQATLATGGGTVQGATPQNDPGSSAGVAYQLEY